MIQPLHTPLLLIILDGWGYRKNGADNAIDRANKPHWDSWWQHYPHTLISGSGICVGLPSDQMGNSEVGHLNMGAGRIVQQELTRIDAAIASGEFFKNPELCAAVDLAVRSGKAVHVLGLVSPGGVHSHENHLHALLRLCQQRNLQRLYIHAFLDGRDTPPQSAATSLKLLENKCNAAKCGQIGSIIGRYYAMDRDQRWDRIQQAYDLLTLGQAEYHAHSAVQGLEQAYQRGETDEFVKATAIHSENTKPVCIEDGDVVIFMNYRADRARQLTRAFTQDSFNHFQQSIRPKLAAFVTLTFYATDIKAKVAYPQHDIQNVLGACLAQNNLAQLRIAETEKYAHVTFFFNGGVEQPFAKEDRILIPSPKIATYDLQPEMSALQITEQVITAIQSSKYAVIICNFANADMVGHTGNLSATIKAIEVLDLCLDKIITVLQQCGGEAIITADHGNAEQMSDAKTGQPHTAHTSEPVPFLYIGRPANIIKQNGALLDIAPTMLYLLNLAKPSEMTGTTLVNLK